MLLWWCCCCNKWISHVWVLVFLSYFSSFILHQNINFLQLQLLGIKFILVIASGIVKIHILMLMHALFSSFQSCCWWFGILLLLFLQLATFNKGMIMRKEETKNSYMIFICIPDFMKKPSPKPQTLMLYWQNCCILRSHKDGLKDTWSRTVNSVLSSLEGQRHYEPLMDV